MIALKIFFCCVAVLMIMVLIDWIGDMSNWKKSTRQRLYDVFGPLAQLVFVVGLASTIGVVLTGCGDQINPVRYQTVEVLVTKPCLAGRTPPAQAVLLTDPVCTLTPAECVRAAAADIAELQREARESRNLIRECSK